jgi:FkbM family methyltransferase
MKIPFKMFIETEIEKWRHATWKTKEPETIEWIKSFKPYNTFFDVGANVGIFTLFAASLHPDSLIYAFEPVKMNFIRLMQNIELNIFQNVIALPIGAGEYTRNSIMREIGNEIGHSGSLIHHLSEQETKRIYLSPVITIDDFVKIWGVIPNHIKIDIDNGEYGHEIRRKRESCA